MQQTGDTLTRFRDSGFRWIVEASFEADLRQNVIPLLRNPDTTAPLKHTLTRDIIRLELPIPTHTPAAPSGLSQPTTSVPAMPLLAPSTPQSAPPPSTPSPVQGEGRVRVPPSASSIPFIPSIFIKHHKPRSLAEALKYLILRSRAAAEFDTARTLARLGIPCAPALALGERRTASLLREAVLVTAEIPGAVRLLDQIERLGPRAAGPEFRRKRTLLQNAARLVRRLHDAGVAHNDLHAGNILVTGETLHLIDLHRARCSGPVPARRRVADLAQLLHSLNNHLTSGDRLSIVAQYQAGPSNLPHRNSELGTRNSELSSTPKPRSAETTRNQKPETRNPKPHSANAKPGRIHQLRTRNSELGTLFRFFRRVLTAAERIRQARYASRTLRCLKPSTGFRHERLTVTGTTPRQARRAVSLSNRSGASKASTPHTPCATDLPRSDFGELSRAASAAYQSGDARVTLRPVTIRVHRRADFPTELIAAAIQQHTLTVTGTSGDVPVTVRHTPSACNLQPAACSLQPILKRSPRGSVTSVRLTDHSPLTTDHSPGPLCVKEFDRPGLRRRLGDLILGSPARRAWLGSHACSVRGIPVPRAYAVAQAGPRAWLITEYIEHAQRLNDYAADHCRPATPAAASSSSPSSGTGFQPVNHGQDGHATELRLWRAFIRQAADFVRLLHSHRIRHRDLSAKNILVRHDPADPGRFQFYLVDLSDIRLGPPSPAFRTNNLGQLAQIYVPPSRTDLLRFYRRYARGRHEHDLRDLFARILAIRDRRQQNWLRHGGAQILEQRKQQGKPA